MLKSKELQINERLDEIKAANPHVDLHAYCAHGHITVSLIRVDTNHRRQGLFTSTMQQVIELADKAGISIAVSPTSEFGTAKGTLTKMYKALGFTSNKGRIIDFTISETMIRKAAIK